jgi:hypothetical protein
VCYATAASNSKTATDFASIAGVVIRGRRMHPVNLARFDHLNWMTTEKPIWFIAEHLCDIPHISLLTPAMEKNLLPIERSDQTKKFVVEKFHPPGRAASKY